MPYLPLAIPPGVVKPSTNYQAKGRWTDSSLIRWYEGNMQPIGTWSSLISAGSVGSHTVRGMFQWRINSGISRIMLGTYDHIYVYDGETVPITPTTSDITPNSGFTAGTDGFSVWQFDNFGEDVVCCLPKNGAIGDGDLWLYDASAPTTDVAAITATSGTAPVNNLGVFVTPERFVVAIGADGDPRKVAWPDQESLVDWEYSNVSNQAGTFPVQTKGRLLRGVRARGESLLFTDVDLWAMRYIGGSLVYSFQQVGSQCGAISSRAMALVDGKAIWMGRNGFYMYDGFVRDLPCDLGDYIFGRQPAGTNLVQPLGAGLDRNYSTLVACFPNTQYREVTWLYPSLGTAGVSPTGENDRYITYNYALNIWYGGVLARSDGIEDGGDSAFGRPLLAATGGAIYQHEYPYSTGDWGGATPYATSGPIEIGDGDQVMTVRSFIPDSKLLGQWRTTIYGAMYPTATETTYGPYTDANPTDILLTARQIRIKAEVSGGSYTHRYGTPRLELVGRGRW